jgi:diguanylate cyclase (GGDEF)-like protein
MVQEEINRSNDIILSTYEGISEVVYKVTITDEIEALIDEANTASSERKDEIRQLIFEEYEHLYEYFSEINFRQFHFHLLGGESLLRFHRPETYGDNLTGIRDSVTRAQEEGVFVEGFEEGKIFNGYRFVYPIYHDEVVVGSVEVSVSYMTVDELAHEFSQYHTIFLIKNEVVNAKVFEDEIENYVRVEEFPDFYVEVMTDEIETLAEAIEISNEDLHRINSIVNESIIDGHYNDMEVNIHDLDDKTIFTIINPVENINGDVVAYNVYYGNEEIYRQMSEVDKTTMIIVYMMNIMVLLTLIIIAYFFIRAREISYRDKLTNLYNRTYFNKKIVNTIQSSEKTAIIMLDIDDFKKINDTYGHNEGDKVLKIISKIIEENIRNTDVPIRWGGEEFTVILTNSAEEQGVRIAERIRKSIEAYTFGNYPVTASFGVTEYVKDEEIINFFKRVDENLYSAKREGKNITVSTGKRKV